MKRQARGAKRPTRHARCFTTVCCDVVVFVFVTTLNRFFYPDTYVRIQPTHRDSVLCPWSQATRNTKIRGHTSCSIVNPACSLPCPFVLGCSNDLCRGIGTLDQNRVPQASALLALIMEPKRSQFKPNETSRIVTDQTSQKRDGIGNLYFLLFCEVRKGCDVISTVGSGGM